MSSDSKALLLLFMTISNITWFAASGVIFGNPFKPIISLIKRE